MKKIKPGEEFQMHDTVFTYSMSESGSISLKIVRKTESKPSKAKKGFIPPSIEDVIKYFADNGYSEESAKKFHMSYSAGEPPWHDSQGKPVIAWKQKAINVWFKPENLIKKQGGNNTSFSFKE